MPDRRPPDLPSPARGDERDPERAPGDGPVPPPESELRRWLPSLAPDDPRHRLRSDGAAAVWNGMVWGRLGRGDLAWAWFDRVAQPDLQPWIAAERGRLLREVGLHARAKAIEEVGLREASDLVDVVMLRLSLAADAVGLGRITIARSALEGASDMLDELPASPRVARQRLRRAWVRTEIDITSGVPPQGDGLPWLDEHGEVQLPIEHAHGTDFHRAKGLLFAAVALHEPGMLLEAAALAPPALRWAVELARLDAGDDRAADRAVAAWRAVTAPTGYAAEVAAGATARRISELA